jgi:hypothetical protein
MDRIESGCKEIGMVTSGEDLSCRKFAMDFSRHVRPLPAAPPSRPHSLCLSLTYGFDLEHENCGFVSKLRILGLEAP